MDRIWQRLLRVRSVRFDARSALATGWNGVGTGEVRVSTPAPGQIIFHESGTWQAKGVPTSATRFSNVFRWSAMDGTLRLEHLRMGLEHPVMLFDMVATPEGQWQVLAPHQCGKDCYQALLSFEEEKLLMSWTIHGPRKRETIVYTYV